MSPGADDDTATLLVHDGVDDDDVGSVIELDIATETKVVGFKDQDSPEDSAGLLSLLTHSWIDKLVYHCYKNDLEFDHLWNLARKDRSDTLMAKNRANLAQELMKERPTYIRAALKTFGWYFLRSWVFMAIYVACQFAGPLLLQRMVLFIVESRQATGPHPNPHLGYYYAIGLFLFAMLGSLSFYSSNLIASRTGTYIRSTIACDVYKKALRLSNSSRAKTSVGEIVNLMSNDAQRVVEVFMMLNTAIFAPVQIVVAMIFLYTTIGWASFAGLGFMVLIFPVNGWVTTKGLGETRRAITKFTDRRLKMVNEILSSIKIVKLYAWETAFSNRLNQVREQELSQLYRFAYIRAFLLLIITSVPTLVSVIVFSTYYAYYRTLEADKLFAALAYLNILKVPLGMLPIIAAMMVQTQVSIKRVTEFLVLPEIPPIAEPANPSTPAGVYIDRAQFSWTDQDSAVSKGFMLNNITATCTGPSLTMVVGSVGSGKSSICQAMLGEMTLVNGQFTLRGRVAYVSQQAWLVNATMRDNIIFGSPFDSDRYHSVISACALERDIELFAPHGDLVQIGERGITLSGGQKARVSLARSLYNDADIYILDDPLSAVDAHVSKHLFHHAILGMLKNKTVILATNQLNYLHHASHILLMKDGLIHQQGTHTSLVKETTSDYFTLVQTHGCIEDHVITPSIESTTPKPQTPVLASKQQDNKLIQEEERSKGTVSNSTILHYFRSWGSPPLVIGLMVLFLVEVGSRALSDWWMAHWSSNRDTSDPMRGLYIYLAIGVGSIVATGARNFIFFGLAVRAGAVMHRKMFASIIRAPMSFFDTTPLGRIVNRFTRDQDVVDTLLPQSVSQSILLSLTVIITIFVVAAMTPPLLFVLVPIAIIFYFIQTLYRYTSRELQRLVSVMRSPIFEHFTETLHGATTIRAYAQQPRNILENELRVDRSNMVFITLQAANQWLGLRLDLLGNLVILAAASFIAHSRDTIDVASVGLALSYALSITASLNKATIQVTDIENKLNSVERVLHYTDGVPTEASASDPSPPSSWPSKGEITVSNLVMRYRPGLTPVINGISAKIGAKEKIGIVGRTGAGKSSILTALFRLVEATEGSIVIDGVDISSIGLSHLRRNIAIIPQDPVLFGGTIKSNLDPFNESSDDDLWQTLRDIQLSAAVSELDGGLDSVVTDNGSNLSVGQAQLIALGRALLRRPKILVLDEATASVDSQTDALIQSTIRDKFNNATILTIAHRLNTIMNSDRIMVIDAGRITEFDTPKNLLNNPHGLFTWLVDETGVQNSALLRRMVD
eukprot:gene4374-5117_t